MVYFGGYQGKIVFLELKEEKMNRKPSTDSWTIHPARWVWQQRRLEVGSCCSFSLRCLPEAEDMAYAATAMRRWKVLLWMFSYF